LCEWIVTWKSENKEECEIVLLVQFF